MRGELQSLKHNEVKPGRLRMSKPSNAPFQPRCCVEGPVHVLARPTNLCCCLWCQQPGYFANCGVQPNYKHCHAPKQLKVPIRCCTMLTTQSQNQPRHSCSSKKVETDLVRFRLPLCTVQAAESSKSMVELKGAMGKSPSKEKSLVPQQVK